MEKPYISVKRVELRDKDLDHPVEVFVVKLETAEGVWIEQFTELEHVTHFLRGIKALAGVMHEYLEYPAVVRFPGGTVQIENPSRGRMCPFCDGRGSTLAAVADRDPSIPCDKCGGTGRL